MVSAVIFDCDGVLVDSEVIAHAVELAVLAEIGLEYDPHDFTIRFMGRSDKVFFEMLDADGRKRRPSGPRRETIHLRARTPPVNMDRRPAPMERAPAANGGSA